MKFNNQNYSTIGIVTHGGPIWAIFTDILNNNRLVHIGDCAYVVLDKNDQNLKIEKLDGIEIKKWKIILNLYILMLVEL